jgi:GMP synthase (glutamine-hydrolysing)
VYCEIHPFHVPLEKIKTFDPKGSSSQVDLPVFMTRERRLLMPGFWTSMSLFGNLLRHAVSRPRSGQVVTKAEEREYGRSLIKINDFRSIFHGFNRRQEELVWMSHGDRIEKMPKGFKSLASSKNSPVAAMADPVRKLFECNSILKWRTHREECVFSRTFFKVRSCEPV